MERPILFSGEMVRAILAGRKTQTRRVVRGQVGALDRGQPTIVGGPACPYGAPGDRLWVRETFALSIRDPDSAFEPDAKDPSCWDGAAYRATYDGGDWEHRYESGRLIRVPPPWRPSIHMPRWASRITLEVTAVRVERLQDITEEDARAEGCEASVTTWVRHEPNGDWELSTEPFDGATPERATARDVYERLWHAINGKRAPWSSNPWVWVVSFRRVEP